MRRRVAFAVFNNLRVVEIDGSGRAVVREHVLLAVVLEVTGHHRLGGSAAPRARLASQPAAIGHAVSPGWPSRRLC